MHSLLGIEGLSAAVADLRLGRIYALSIEERALSLPLAWATLLSALAAKRAAWLVTETSPPVALNAPGALVAAAREAVAAELIRVFHGLAAARLPDGQDAAGRMIEELDYFAIPAGALLAIEGGDRFLGEAVNAPRAGAKAAGNVAAIEQWQAWARCRGISVLFLCHRRDDNPNPAARLQASAEHLGGFARLRRSDGVTSWEVFHWFGPEGVCAGKTYPLSLRDDGRLAASVGQAPRLSFEPAIDEHSVVAMRAALPGQRTLPSGWTVVDDLAELGKSAATAVAATVIVAFDRHAALDKLIHFIFTLRQERGSRLKIVVREVDVRLRYSQEILLTHLGGNLVVPAEVSHSRLLSLVSMVQGQVFQRQLPSNYGDAVAAAMPVMEQGYLPPQAFAEAVASAVDSSRGVGVDNALIHLPLVLGLRAIDALRYCLMKRPGDLCSADEGSLYVFLFACRANDVALALDRLFQLPVGELFNGEHRYLSPISIRSAIEEFATRAGSDALPDLNEALQTLQAAYPGATPILTAIAGSALAKDSGPIQRQAPAPAVARPLPLRHLTAVPRTP